MRQTLVTHASLFAAAGVCAAADAPQILPHNNYHNYYRVGDEVWKTRAVNATWGAPPAQHFGVYRARSSDNGVTWVEEVFNQTTHLFDSFSGLNAFPYQRKDGSLAFVQPRTIDGVASLYYFQSNPSITSWSAAEVAVDGAVHTIQESWDVIELGSGRMIAPFYGRQEPLSGYGGTGRFQTKVSYKDPGGSWTVGPSVLKSPVPSDWNGAADGAVAAAVVQLDYNNTTNSDTNVWMLGRSQTGRMWQSTSADGGETWAPVTDSKFYSSTGTPSISRVLDADGEPTDRIVMLWCNATMPQRGFEGNPTNNALWYAGRDALHAAVSDDNGVTWKGFREVYLDPTRHEMPEADDTGVSQAFVAAAPNGWIVGTTGQGRARAVVRFDPDWLLGRDQSDDITSADPLTDKVLGWSLWTDYGNVGEGAAPGVKRPRYVGTEIIDDGASVGGTNKVLRVRKDNATRTASGAVWNFPSAVRGQTSARIRLEPGSDGAYVSLTDRFFNPTDPQGHDLAFYRFEINPDGTTNAGGAALTPGEWANVTIDYNVDTARIGSPKALIRINGQVVGTLAANGSADDPWSGLNYLRFRSRSPQGDVDAAGLLIDSVDHDGSNLRDAVRMNAAELTAALDTGGGDWTRIRFDSFVPNTNTTTSGNGATLVHNGAYTGMAGSGLVIESSTGTVVFSDGTSAQVTSDIVGPANGNTLSIRFVDPTDGSTPATVSDVALRIGSVAASNVLIEAYDLNGNLLPDWVFGQLASGVNTTFGLLGQEDLARTSVIHELRLSGAGADGWLIGSFSGPTSQWDFAYSGLTVPEPTSLAGGLLATAALLRRTRRSAARDARGSAPNPHLPH